jgi:type IV pilus assembly protein PilE
MNLRQMPGGRAMRGFTLMEVMITVAIIGILSAIALPRYRDYVTRGRIIEGTSKLSDYRVRMEQYFMDNRTYRLAGNCGVDPAVYPGFNAAQDAFQITCVAADDRSYVATATGVAGKGMGAFAYTINQANAHATTGLAASWNSANAANCWITKPDGAC